MSRPEFSLLRGRPRPGRAAAPTLALSLLLALATSASAGGRVARPASTRPATRERPTLVILRHGESEANRDGRFAGWRDVPLTRRGRAQARRAGRGLRGIRFGKAYSSKLSRAADTLDLALEGAGQARVPTRRTQALNERRYGIMEGQTRPEAIARYGLDRVTTWRLSLDTAPPGGESLRDVERRAGGFVDREVIADLEAGHNVLLAAHRHTIRALVGHIEGLSEAERAAFEVPNATPLYYQLGDDGRLHRVPDSAAPGRRHPVTDGATPGRQRKRR